MIMLEYKAICLNCRERFYFFPKTCVICKCPICGESKKYKIIKKYRTNIDLEFKKRNLYFFRKIRYKIDIFFYSLQIFIERLYFNKLKKGK